MTARCSASHFYSCKHIVTHLVEVEAAISNHFSYRVSQLKHTKSKWTGSMLCGWSKRWFLMILVSENPLLEENNSLQQTRNIKKNIFRHLTSRKEQVDSTPVSICIVESWQTKTWDSDFESSNESWRTVPRCWSWVGYDSMMFNPLPGGAPRCSVHLLCIPPTFAGLHPWRTQAPVPCEVPQWEDQRIDLWGPMQNPTEGG